MGRDAGSARLEERCGDTARIAERDWNAIPYFGHPLRPLAPAILRIEGTLPRKKSVHSGASAVSTGYNPMPNLSHNPAEAFAEYAATGCEVASRTLVTAHLGLVHSTAMRLLLNGDSHAAQDVAQEVFTLLARKARRLPRGITPASWLYRQAYRRALNSIRRASSRRRREAIAAPDLEPSPANDMDPA